MELNYTASFGFAEISFKIHTYNNQSNVSNLFRFEVINICLQDYVYITFKTGSALKYPTSFEFEQHTVASLVLPPVECIEPECVAFVEYKLTANA